MSSGSRTFAFRESREPCAIRQPHRRAKVDPDRFLMGIAGKYDYAYV